MLKKYTKGSWPSLVTIETMRKLALHSDPFRDAPLARYLGFKCKVCPTILPYLVYRTYLQFSSKLIYRSQVHCYHVVQLVAKLEGRNCVLTQRKAHQKLDVSTEVPTVSYLKGRIADTSYILCMRRCCCCDGQRLFFVCMISLPFSENLLTIIA